MEFYEYEWMLNRALEKLPKNVLETVVFEIPTLSVNLQGSKTYIVNFAEAADKINRPADHLLKYLSRELATAGILEGRRAMFQGKFTQSVLAKKLELYVNEYVICRQCGRHDTKLTHEGRIWMVQCMACGAKEPVKGI